jgi:outer membrane protein OmpA-like peptidoglycan-associated protein
MMKRLTHILATLLFLVSGTVNGYAQLAVHGEAKSLLGIEVHFRFDKSYFDINYMGNDASLDRFAHVVDSIGKHFIDSVVIVSQSSPEGVYEHNVKLSRRRAATMRSVIEQRHPDLSSRLRVHPDGES